MREKQERAGENGAHAMTASPIITYLDVRPGNYFKG
jgi:hypothetical protein